MPELHTVVAQEWEESERGWGIRPDGLSLHLTAEDAREYARLFMERQRKHFQNEGEWGTPDEYTRVSGSPVPVTVNDSIYKQLQESSEKHGLMTRFLTLRAAGDLSKPEAALEKQS